MDSEQVKPRSSGIGLYIYIERIEKAAPSHRWAMARVALTLSYPTEDYPIDLSDAVSGLGWDDYHVVLGMLAMYANAPLYWNDIHLSMLRAWAHKQPE